MGKVVCVDAIVYLDGTEFPERNEATISFEIDIAEARPFKANASAVPVPDKAATWGNASVSLSGFYDDADFSAIDNALAGGSYALLVYPDRDTNTTYWQATIIISSMEHTITSEDFSEVNIEGEVSGSLVFEHA